MIKRVQLLRWRHLCWMPFGAGSLWFAAEALGGRIELGAPLLLAGVGLGAAWLIGRRLIPLAVVVALLAVPLAYRQFVRLPAIESALQEEAEGGYLRIRGTVRRQERITLPGGSGLRYLLGEAEVESGGRRFALPELEVRFPGRLRQWRARRREVRIGGYSVGIGREGGRLALTLADARYHFAAEPTGGHSGEWLRRALADRAGYYLPNATHAVYLPILLGVRDTASPEARRVTGAFRRVGVAHLFAISGLHVGLLFLLLMAVLHWISALTTRGQGGLHSRQAMRIGVTALIWAYIALIGFPVPAVRAAVMGTMVVWSQLWGTRTPQVYVLVLTALLMLLVAPSQLYDLSFQLSFLAYLFVVLAIRLWERRPRPERRRRWWSALLSGAALNLLITFWITLGLWPVLAAAFGRVSLLVFAGNLLMVPLLSAVVLPSGLLALATSLFHLGSLPGGWAERAVFGWLDWVLGSWVALVRLIDEAGAALVFRLELDWTPRAFIVYYLTLFLAYALLVRGLDRRWNRRGSGPDRGALRTGDPPSAAGP